VIPLFDGKIGIRRTERHKIDDFSDNCRREYEKKNFRQCEEKALYVVFQVQDMGEPHEERGRYRNLFSRTSVNGQNRSHMSS
jgi:hypothetical protein